MTATERALELTRAAAQAAADKLGTDILAYDVSEQLVITDVFLLVSATNERQVGAIVDGVEEKLREFDAKPVRREGDRERRWVLLDFLEIVVHVQHSEERTLYALERLWGDCPAIELGLDPASIRNSEPQSDEDLDVTELDSTEPEQTEPAQP